MKLFLTSNIGGSYKENGIRVPSAIDGSNHFLELLNKNWTEDAKCLIISSDPENEDINNSFRDIFKEAFRMSGLSLSRIDVCDRRNENELADTIYDYDVLLLAGGHVPTQNSFFNKLHLKELLKRYQGIVIGISAGTMNCADIVYAQPEIEGEAADPCYKRYLEGLNLTRISILPHYQDITGLLIDGMRIIEDISLPDSKIRPFYALVDGAYIFTDGSKSTLYGEAYLFKDGVVKKICETGRSIQLVKNSPL